MLYGIRRMIRNFHREQKEEAKALKYVRKQLRVDAEVVGRRHFNEEDMWILSRKNPDDEGHYYPEGKTYRVLRILNMPFDLVYKIEVLQETGYLVVLCPECGDIGPRVYSGRKTLGPILEIFEKHLKSGHQQPMRPIHSHNL